MKNLAHKLMVVAAAMAAVAGTVSAQSMKAEVPFSFKVSGTVMPAGTYMVTAAHHTSTPIFRILNTDVSRSVLVLPASSRDEGPSRSREAKLVFRCSVGNCALAQIWSGTGIGAYDLHLPKPGREEAALVTIAAMKAD